MKRIPSEIVSIASASLGSLRGRSVLLIGSDIDCRVYKQLLQEEGTETVFQEKNYANVSKLLPQIQLLINIPNCDTSPPLLSAGTIAKGCIGRRTPLVIFDLATSTSVEEIAGLLPAVCLYTPPELQNILHMRPKFSMMQV